MENLYLIKLSSGNEVFYKIGTTVHRFCRFYEIMKSGYSVEIIYMVHGIEFYEALNAEKYLQRMFDGYCPLVKFGGYTECFKYVDLNVYKNNLHSSITSHKEITQNIKISWR